MWYSEDDDDDDTSDDGSDDDGISYEVPGEESSCLIEPVYLSKRHGDV